jgi:hypothetical protein
MPICPLLQKECMKFNCEWYCKVETSILGYDKGCVMYFLPELLNDIKKILQN